MAEMGIVVLNILQTPDECLIEGRRPPLRQTSKARAMTDEELKSDLDCYAKESEAMGRV